eukprot:11860.XXX_42081_42194_1 [CDS] Oithona nana genome sequencing.
MANERAIRLSIIINHPGLPGFCRSATRLLMLHCVTNK